MTNFVAIDFETANRSPASACAIGMVRVRGGEMVARDAFLIHPPAGHDHFEPFNVQLHGISAERIATAPGWHQAREQIIDFVADDVIVAHNAGFDIGVFVAASRALGLPVPAMRYLCSLRLARKHYQLPSYRLPAAANAAGYTLANHHDPLEDAEACAAIVIDVARSRRAVDLDALSQTTSVQIQQLEPQSNRDHDDLIAAATF